MLEDFHRELEGLGAAIRETACNRSHVVHLCFIQKWNTGKSNRKWQPTIGKGSNTVVALRLVIHGKMYLFFFFF